MNKLDKDFFKNIGKNIYKNKRKINSSDIETAIQEVNKGRPLTILEKCGQEFSRKSWLGGRRLFTEEDVDKREQQFDSMFNLILFILGRGLILVTM